MTLFRSKKRKWDMLYEEVLEIKTHLGKDTFALCYKATRVENVTLFRYKDLYDAMCVKKVMEIKTHPC